MTDPNRESRIKQALEDVIYGASSIDLVEMLNDEELALFITMAIRAHIRRNGAGDPEQLVRTLACAPTPDNYKVSWK